jgi:hypothetical protein
MEADKRLKQILTSITLVGQALGFSLPGSFIVLKGADTGWVAEYRRRMRRFNLEVILAALTFLVIVITLTLMNW